MNLVRQSLHFITSILLFHTAVGEISDSSQYDRPSSLISTAHPQNDASKINIDLDEIRKLAANIGKETARLTNVEERLKSEMKRMKDGIDSTIGKIMPEFQSVRTELTNVEERLQSEIGNKMDFAIGKIMPEFQSVRTELGNVGQKLEETLLMGMEEAGNKTIDALRRDQKLPEVPPRTFSPIYYRGSMISPEYPKNCEEIQLLGHNSSGVYHIYPFDLKEFPIGREVYCDLLTAGGGWTVIQRRKESLNTQEDFERTWDEYASGFGNLNESHWIGLDVIAALTRKGDNKLRIEMTDWEGENRVAAYTNFRIANASNLYRLNVSGYYGDAGDSLMNKNGMAFSTKDSDNDEVAESCAHSYRGAWWYKKCHRSNLNGLYLGTTNNGGKHDSFANSIIWHSWHGYNYSLKRTEMKIRSNHFHPEKS